MDCGAAARTSSKWPPRHSTNRGTAFNTSHCNSVLWNRVTLITSPASTKMPQVLRDTVLVSQREDLRTSGWLAAGDVHTKEQQLTELVDLAKILPHATEVPTAVLLLHLLPTPRCQRPRDCLVLPTRHELVLSVSRKICAALPGRHIDSLMSISTCWYLRSKAVAPITVPRRL